MMVIWFRSHTENVLILMIALLYIIDLICITQNLTLVTLLYHSGLPLIEVNAFRIVKQSGHLFHSYVYDSWVLSEKPSGVQFTMRAYRHLTATHFTVHMYLMVP